MKPSALLTFFDWWLRQLTEMLPSGLARLGHRYADAAIISVESDGVALLSRREGSVSFVTRGRAQSEAGYRQIAEAIAGMDPPPQQLLLRVPPSMVLRKPVSFPVAARGDLESLIGFEMDRETPFARNEVFWTYVLRRQDSATGRLDVELFIVPRPFVDPIIEAVRRAGLEPSGIELGADTEQPTLIRLGAPDRWEWLRKDPRKLRMAAAAAGAVLLVVLFPLINQQVLIAIDDSRIRGLKEQAVEAADLRQTVDQANGVLELVNTERTRCGGTLDVLAAATKLLPDDSHLTAFSLRSGRLTISGLSPAAAHLVDLLAQSTAFREPAFDSPVVQNDDSGLELFTISVSLSPDGLKNEARKIALEQKGGAANEPTPQEQPPAINPPKPDGRKSGSLRDDDQESEQ